MTIRPPKPEIEVPVSAMGLPEVGAFQRYLTDAGRMSPDSAEGFTRALVAAILVDIGRWCGRVTRLNLIAIVHLRTELKIRYVAALRLLGEGRTELPPDLQPKAFRDIYGELFRRMNEVVGFGEQVRSNPDAAIDAVLADLDAPGSVEVPLHEARAELEGTDLDEPYRPPDEPPSPEFDDPEAAQAEAEARRHADDPDLAASQRQGVDPLLPYNRDLRRVLTRFGDRPPSARGPGEVPAIPRALAEGAAEMIRRDFLGAAGIDDVRVEQQPVLGPHMAAEGSLGVFDPVRDIGYEISFRDPVSGQRIKPDGYAVLSGDTFQFLEHKAHEAVPGRGFFDGRSGVELLRDMEVRARLAQRIPGCQGWRYSADLPELTEVLDWAVRTLRRELPPGLDAPAAASESFVRAVQRLANDPATQDWARMLRVAP